MRPAIERGAETLAGLCLGGAIAFGIFQLAPLDGAMLVAASSFGGLASAVCAVALLRLIDSGRRSRGLAFEPATFDQAGDVEYDVDDDDELLLDDPITPLDPTSRVIRLFQPEQSEPLPEPGELVARIADYLDSGRAARPVVGEPVDASDALHAALADIRRSLR